MEIDQGDDSENGMVMVTKRMYGDSLEAMLVMMAEYIDSRN